MKRRASSRAADRGRWLMMCTMSGVMVLALLVAAGTEAFRARHGLTGVDGASVTTDVSASEPTTPMTGAGAD